MPSGFSHRPRSWRKIVAWACLALAVFAWAAIAYSLPDVSELARGRPALTAYMRIRAAESGVPQRAIRWVPLDSVSVVAACAVVKAEDADFFTHGGVDWRRVRESMRGALAGKEMTGASTITQQLARNLYLRPERTVRRKLREALIAGSLERHLTKREILELHLNVVEWGDGVWGIGQAAPHYLGRSPTSVGAFEAAFLASLLPAPRRPLAGANLLRARRVQGRVLTQLHLSGMLDVREWRGAMGSRRAFVTAMTRGSRPAWALAMARVAPPADLRDPAPASVVRLPASRALDSACGRAVELRSSGAVGRGAGR